MRVCYQNVCTKRDKNESAQTSSVTLKQEANKLARVRRVWLCPTDIFSGHFGDDDQSTKTKTRKQAKQWHK